ncbi:PA0069 family radical SAM protein [Kaarinaea lacus]
MDSKRIKGRGISDNPTGRYELFERQRTVIDQNEWGSVGQWKTHLHVDYTKSIINTNNSPDVPFNRSINPYRGCEHGCVYCFARPTHSWLGYSPGLEFESEIIYKPNAEKLLRSALEKPGYQCEPIVIGANTDAYQPAERKLGITRRLLKTFEQYRHPVAVITKSSLIERDIDILAQLATKNLVLVHISICTMQAELSRKMEPRTSSPKRRLDVINNLTSNGIPVNLLVAPVIPVLNDSEMETILKQAKVAGASSASYVLLRLPHELKTLFVDWLEQEYPLKANHVMQRLRECRGGREYDSAFGQRMQGKGLYADMINNRFELARKRLRYANVINLDTSAFQSPSQKQLPLF